MRAKPRLVIDDAEIPLILGLTDVQPVDPPPEERADAKLPLVGPDGQSAPLTICPNGDGTITVKADTEKRFADIEHRDTLDGASITAGQAVAGAGGRVEFSPAAAHSARLPTD